MWLALIISGALHGFVLLPVVISFAGGRGYALEDADEEWMSSIIRRNDYTYVHTFTYTSYEILILISIIQPFPCGR